MKTKWRVLCVVLAAVVLIAALPGVSMAAATVAAPKIASVKVVSASALTVNWKAVKKAKGYEVYRSTAKAGTYKKVKTVTKAATVSFTNKSLKAATPYYYKVRAYATVGGKKVYSKFSAVKGGKTKAAASTPTPTPAKPGKQATVTSIEVPYISFDRAPNGTLWSATIDWRINLSNSKDCDPLESKLSMATTDYNYRAYDHAFSEDTVTNNVSGRSSVSNTTKVYCIGYGGTNNGSTPTTLTIKAGGVTKVIYLPMRAGSLTGGGYYYSD